MIIRGPFTIRWGDVVVQDVEEMELDTQVTSEDYETAKGVNIQIDKTYKAEATITILSTDVPILAALLPQHFVPFGGTLSTGETVDEEQGSMDFSPRKCNPSTVYFPLDIISCSNQGQRTRLVNCRTRLEDIDVTNKLQKIVLKFIGEAEPSQGVIQIFRDITPTPETLFALDDGDLFQLEDGDNLSLYEQ